MVNKSWLKKIYVDYQNLVYRTAVSITKDPQLAEDVVQDVFVTLYYKGAGIRDKSRIKSWLVRTTVNRAIDFTRHQQKVVNMPGDFFEFQEQKSWADPAASMDQKEMAQEMKKAVNSLPAELKALVTLYYYLETPQKEIAAALNIPLGTVKTRLKRARDLLKHYFLKIEENRPASGVSKDEEVYENE